MHAIHSIYFSYEFYCFSDDFCKQLQCQTSPSKGLTLKSYNSLNVIIFKDWMSLRWEKTQSRVSSECYMCTMEVRVHDLSLIYIMVLGVPQNHGSAFQSYFRTVYFCLTPVFLFCVIFRKPCPCIQSMQVIVKTWYSYYGGGWMS